MTGDVVNLRIAIKMDLDLANHPWMIDCVAYTPKKARMQIIDIFIRAGAPINRADANGDTALGHAVLHGYFDAAKFLLEQGADPNAGKSFRSIEKALVRNDFETATLLRTYGADTTFDPMLDAIVRGDPLALQSTLESGYGVHGFSWISAAIHLAPSRVHARAIVELLLDRGANPDGAGDCSPPLLAAIAAGDDA